VCLAVLSETRDSPDLSTNFFSVHLHLGLGSGKIFISNLFKTLTNPYQDSLRHTEISQLWFIKHFYWISAIKVEKVLSFWLKFLDFDLFKGEFNKTISRKHQPKKSREILNLIH